MTIDPSTQILLSGGEPSASGCPAAPLEGLGVPGQDPARTGTDVLPRSKLDNVYGHNYNKDLPLEITPDRTKKKKNAYYHAFRSGILWHKDDNLYWLTLTSAPNSPPLPRSFNQLITELRRVTVKKLMTWGYVTYYERGKWYKTTPFTEPLTVEYLSMRTSEGCGVLHIVIAPSFRIPVEYLRDTWVRIHGAHSLNIQHIKTDYSIDKLLSYALAQYALGQQAYIRHDVSSNWLWRGYRKTWKRMVKVLGYQTALTEWTACLAAHRVPDMLPYIERSTPWKPSFACNVGWNLKGR